MITSQICRDYAEKLYDDRTTLHVSCQGLQQGTLSSVLCKPTFRPTLAQQLVTQYFSISNQNTN
jgi:hypothetical protein